MAQYSQRTQPMHRPGQSDHGHSGGALSYGGKPAGTVVAPPQPRPPPTAPYASQPYPPAQLRLHQPGYGSAALSYRDGSYARSGGAVGEYRSGGRMSLLGAAYLPPPAPASHHPPPADPPPFKKIRLTAERAPITQLTHHLPLRVDTREPVNTYNTVEVLSPNPPSETSGEDQTLRTTKDVLLKQISKVDREMALVETSLAKLKRKQEELQQSASKPARAEEPEEAPSRHRSLAQCIYAENRKKAAAAHAQLDHLGPPVPYPLYNQPQDTEVYHENIRKHRLFRKRLIVHIRRIKAESEKREDVLADEYTKRAAEWARRVERIEQSQKRKAKDAKNREFFEKVFPELRKQREERERFHRLGARVKSEAELEELADGLHEQEHEDKKMRALTVVPPLRRDPLDTTPIYLDTNTLIPGRCLDMKSEHKELQLRNIWSQNERELFREKYLQHPKNFGTIASFLPRKNVRDCVRFYYLSKKSENYKQLLRKPRQRRSTRNPQRAAPEPDLPAGVTTRLQRSQGARCADVKEPAMEEGAGAVLIPEPSAVPLPAGAAPSQPLSYAAIRVELARTPPLPPSPPPASSAPLAVTTSSSMPLTIASMDSPSSIPIPPTSPPPTATLIEIPLLTTAATTETTITITALSSVQESSPPSAPSPVSMPSPASTPVSTSPSTIAPVSTSSSSMTTTAPSTTTVATTTPPTVVVSAVVTCTPSSTPTSVLVPAPAVTAVAAAGPTSAPPTPQPANPPTPTQPPPTPETAVIERIGTPSTSTTSTTTSTTTVTASSSNCAVCSAPGATRTVSRSRAAHYGLKEESVGSRVCEACHCRCVRSRYTRCPVPTCPGPRVRAKRLRHLPPRWHDLAIELKRPLMEEFQIPSELSKCCLSCLKRITRRLEGAGPGCEPAEDEFRGWLREHGTAWEQIAAVSGRTPAALKAYYFTYRKKLQLDAVVSARNSASAAARSTSEESGSSESEGAAPPAPAPAASPDPRPALLHDGPPPLASPILVQGPSGGKLVLASGGKPVLVPALLNSSAVLLQPGGKAVLLHNIKQVTQPVVQQQQRTTVPVPALHQTQTLHHQIPQTQVQIQQQVQQPTPVQPAPQPAATPLLPRRGLSLTREQMLEAQDMFRNANRVTRPEKALILGFMAGSRDNPCPNLGNIVTIKLSENIENVLQSDDTYLTMLSEMHFQMNYNNGQWTRLKKYRPIDGMVPQKIPPGSTVISAGNQQPVVSIANQTIS